jgi:hypothetical protein
VARHSRTGLACARQPVAQPTAQANNFLPAISGTTMMVFLLIPRFRGGRSGMNG